MSGYRSGEWRRRILTAAAKSAVPGALAETLGAHTIADKLDRVRTEGDSLAIDVPARRGSIRSRRTKMLRFHGNDQGVELIARGGPLAFEPPLVSFMIWAVRQFTGAVFDVGANTGLYALLARVAQPRADVYACEPFPPVRQRLSQNIALNRGLRIRPDRLHVLDVAVSDVVGEISLFVPAPTGDLIETSASMDPTFKEHIADEVRVRSTTLDCIWKSQGMPRVGVVKIDTEGSEHRVLAGGLELLGQDRPLVVYELLQRGAADRIGEIAARRGYVDARLRPQEIVLGLPIEYDGASWNHLLLPQERMEDLRLVARAVGLRMAE